VKEGILAVSGSDFAVRSPDLTGRLAKDLAVVLILGGFLQELMVGFVVG